MVCLRIGCVSVGEMVELGPRCKIYGKLLACVSFPSIFPSRCAISAPLSFNCTQSNLRSAETLDLLFDSNYGGQGVVGEARFLSERRSFLGSVCAARPTATLPVGKKHEEQQREDLGRRNTWRPRGGNANTTPYHCDSTSHDCLWAHPNRSIGPSKHVLQHQRPRSERTSTIIKQSSILRTHPLEP